jgi:predicted nucleotide-binding protein
LIIVSSSFSLTYEYSATTVAISLDERYQIEAVFEVLEEGLSTAKIEPPTYEETGRSRPTIFVGHGRSAQWRELFDHLRDFHGLDVESFESGPRAGMSAQDVLNQLTSWASFAILVHTAEDEQIDGTLRARQNVVHETGLFQGKLGLRRAIIIREEGCEDFSNVSGVQELRYTHDRIKEVFGDILAILRREFGEIGTQSK